VTDWPHTKPDGTVLRRAAKGCDCPWCTQHRAARRASDAYKTRHQGVPSPAEVAKARAKYLEWRQQGHSQKHIATCIGSWQSNLRLIEIGQAGMYRNTYDAIMAAPAVLPDVVGRKRSGRYVDPTGTRRRLQALHARGFTYVWMSGQMAEDAYSYVRYLWALATGKKSTTLGVTAGVAQSVAALYERYQNADPLQCGIPVREVNRTREAAAKHRYAPPACWDDGDIDNPAATPKGMRHRETRD
jgi:hypothetical protein